MYEYSFRGEALANMNFLSFMLDTYDTKRPLDPIQSNCADDETVQKKLLGRPLNQPVNYQEGFNKPGHCRVFRSEGHETLPQFTGKWIARNDQNWCRELYCASILALLQPWRTLSDIKGQNDSFSDKFQSFHDGAAKKIKDIIENIQYYYECYDGAQLKHKEERVGNIGVLNINNEDEDTEQDGPSAIFAEQPVTEEDIELARENRINARERLYASAMMDIAHECGIFFEDPMETVYLPISPIAQAVKLDTFRAWGEHIKKTTKKAEEIHGDQSVFSLAGNVQQNILGAVANPSVIFSCEPSNSAFHHQNPINSNVIRPVFQMLNADQKRAHDIVEFQLKAHLAGKI